MNASLDPIFAIICYSPVALPNQSNQKKKKKINFINLANRYAFFRSDVSETENRLIKYCFRPHYLSNVKGTEEARPQNEEIALHRPSQVSRYGPHKSDASCRRSSPSSIPFPLLLVASLPRLFRRLLSHSPTPRLHHRANKR